MCYTLLQHQHGKRCIENVPFVPIMSQKPHWNSIITLKTPMRFFYGVLISSIISVDGGRSSSLESFFSTFGVGIFSDDS